MALRMLAAAGVGLGMGAVYNMKAKVSCRPSTVDRLGMPENPDSQDDYGVPHDKLNINIRAETTRAEQQIRDCDKKGHPTQFGGALTTKFQPFKLGEVINLTEETAIFRFLLPKPTDEFILEPCSTLQAMNRAGVTIVEQVQRMYTPITPSGTKGYFDLIVKKQHKGRMTEHLFGMQVGESLLFRVVLHKMRYLPNVYDNIGMIGTGSGITPLLQVIRANVANPEDKTKMSLLFANPTNHRVLLKGTIDDLAAESKGKFTPYYTVDRVIDDGEKWEGFVGFIDEEKVAKTMPPPAPRNLLLVCGSDQLMNSVCGVPLAIMKPWSSGHAMQPAVAHSGANFSSEVGGVLGRLGYGSQHVYRF